MTNDEFIDNALIIAGVILVIVGIWVMKDFGIARYEATRGLCLEYKYDLIVGGILILFGALLTTLVGNRGFKQLIRIFQR
ncbi:hypothetical protein KAU33_02565 [Candidatus Dependentiae bacterium]|nr:hypothetical protein [Candidatus Dependentiae bacterium]